MMRYFTSIPVVTTQCVTLFITCYRECREIKILKDKIFPLFVQWRPKAPRRRKMRHRNPCGTKIRNLRGTKFMFLFQGKIIVATRGEIFSLKFTKYRLAAGLRPDPLGELKRSPKPSNCNNRGLLLRRGEGKG